MEQYVDRGIAQIQDVVRLPVVAGSFTQQRIEGLLPGDKRLAS